MSRSYLRRIVDRSRVAPGPRPRLSVGPAVARAGVDDIVEPLPTSELAAGGPPTFAAPAAMGPVDRGGRGAIPPATPAIHAPAASPLAIDRPPHAVPGSTSLPAPVAPRSQAPAPAIDDAARARRAPPAVAEPTSPPARIAPPVVRTDGSTRDRGRDRNRDQERGPTPPPADSRVVAPRAPAIPPVGQAAARPTAEATPRLAARAPGIALPRARPPATYARPAVPPLVIGRIHVDVITTAPQAPVAARAPTTAGAREATPARLTSAPSRARFGLGQG